jgi:hypothetical protein
MPPEPIKPSIREVLLEEIQRSEAQVRAGATLQQGSILGAAKRKLTGYEDEAILTEWGELFRTGLLAWGLNLSNPNPPFFHLTNRGWKALENATRDPSNPAGYMRHLILITTLNDVALSYLTEGLDCYAAGFFKAAAVMVGGAAESVILDVRDTAVGKLSSLGRSAPKPMLDWRIKTVSDALHNFLNGYKVHFARELRDSYEGYWSAFALQIRAARNDAGHPTSVDPVTADTVHASLLVFPELAKLANSLSRWIVNNLT